MKKKWMYLALLTMFFLLVTTNLMRMFLFGATLLFLFYRKEQRVILLYLLLVITFSLVQSYHPKIPTSAIEGRVVDIRKEYFVLENGFDKYWIQSEYMGSFDDKLKVSCNFVEIHSTINRVGFEFATWANNNRMRYQCSNPKIEVTKTSNSFRGLVYELTQKFPEKSSRVVNMFLFRNHDYSGHYLNILLSSGIHISFLLAWFRRVLRYFFVDENVKIIVIATTIFLSFFYAFSFFILRILTKLLTKYYIIDKRDAWGIYALVLMLIYQGNVHNMVCMFSICLSLVASFSYKKNLFSVFSVVAILQLFYSGFFSLAEYFITRMLKAFFSIVYLLSFIRIWIPLDNIFEFISGLLDCLFSVNVANLLVLKGKPSFLVICLIIIFAISYEFTKEKKQLLIIISLLALNNFQNFVRPYAIVSYIDVGQGDATLIILPFNRGNILIDTGGSLNFDVGKNIVYPVLCSYGINYLDTAILTHDDLDHIGGYKSLSEMLTIKETINNKRTKYLVNNYPIYDLLADHTFDEGNADSLTAYFEIYNTTFLVLGDIGALEEEILVTENDNLQVNILKLSHHGSKTSTSEKLLQKTMPELAIISAGKNNRYNHPSPIVIKRLQSYLVPYLITADSGAIEIAIFPFGYFVHTLLQEFAIIINR